MIKDMIETEIDEFGTRKIYSTNTNSDCAEPWLLGIGNWKVRAPGWHGKKSNDNGFSKLKVTKDDGIIRYNVRAIPNSSSVGETDQSKLRSKGFMGTQKDWKNVEMTIYAKINKAEGKKTEDNISNCYVEVAQSILTVNPAKELHYMLICMLMEGSS